MNNSLNAQGYQPLDPETTYLHAVLAQVGLPRRRIAGRIFTRTTGAASLRAEAGALWDGKVWIDQPLPFGPKPRLLLIDWCEYAVRHSTRVIPLGDSVTDYLRRLGFTAAGGKRGALTAFRDQIRALAACRLSIGIAYGHDAHTIDGKPIRDFHAWIDPRDPRRTLWPENIELSLDFYESLRKHAVPLNQIAVRRLAKSALALDIYTWLAHRLHRIDRASLLLPWPALRQQFGMEYADHQSFSEDFSKQLRNVIEEYPAARARPVRGGVLLRNSPPPVPVQQPCS